MIPPDQWVWHGLAGHLCVADKCRFHLTTEISDHLVSTVGEYAPIGPSPLKEFWESFSLGGDQFYETMVFKIVGRCKCGCGHPETDGAAVDSGRYTTALEARKGHMEFCVLVARLSSAAPPNPAPTETQPASRPN